MTDIQEATPTEKKAIPFGARLKSARESLGLERKDIAAQLRLSDEIIGMLEKDRYPSDLPATFIRGYIRAYGKLVHIPENEVKEAIDPIQPKPMVSEFVPSMRQPMQVTSGNYFMQIFTYLIVLTIVGLVGMWWYNHSSNSSSNALTDSQTTISAIPVETTAPAPQLPSAPTAQSMAVNPVTTAAPVASVNTPISIPKSATEVPPVATAPVEQATTQGQEAVPTRAEAITAMPITKPAYRKQQVQQAQPESQNNNNSDSEDNTD